MNRNKDSGSFDSQISQEAVALKGIRRFTRSEVVGLLGRLSERDKALLHSLQDYRYLLTGQIERLYFHKLGSSRARRRTTNRSLQKLEGLGLTASLERRIGGVRAGSSSFVWTLTPIGHRLLDLVDDTASKARKRSYEPTYTFLQHTLAVAEVAIQLTEHAMRGRIGLLERQVEADGRRAFTNTGGSVSALVPDLYVVTTPVTKGKSGSSPADYEDHWFIEIDLATESPAVVVRKCELYLAYLRSGEEQKRSGVFPLVVWVVPDSKRQTTLVDHITKNLPDDTGLFSVITLGQLTNLVLTGEPDGRPA